MAAADIDREISQLASTLGPILTDARDIDRKLAQAKKRPRGSSSQQQTEEKEKDKDNAENVLTRANMSLSTKDWGNGKESEESHYWKSKFERLRKDKSAGVKEGESELEAAIQKEEAAAKACQQLEQKIQAIQSGNGSDASADKIEQQRRLLAFYELLSSMVVKPSSSASSTSTEDENLFTCTVKNAVQRSVVQFSISNSGGDPATSIKFLPTANVDKLPEYLRSTIECEPDYCPVLLCDVLTALHRDDSDEEAQG